MIFVFVEFVKSIMSVEKPCLQYFVLYKLWCPITKNHTWSGTISPFGSYRLPGYPKKFSLALFHRLAD